LLGQGLTTRFRVCDCFIIEYSFSVQDVPYLDLCSHQPVVHDNRNEEDAESSDDVSLHSISSSQVSSLSLREVAEYDSFAAIVTFCGRLFVFIYDDCLSSTMR
jgi:hypothetical protein